MPNIVIIPIILLLLIFLVILAHYTARYVYNYKIRDNYIEITLFTLPLMRLYFNNISEIRKTSFRESLPFNNAEMLRCLTFENRLWGELILARREKGFFRIIFLSPDKADKFIEEVQARIAMSKTMLGS